MSDGIEINPGMWVNCPTCDKQGRTVRLPIAAIYGTVHIYCTKCHSIAIISGTHGNRVTTALTN